jgi:predicted Zn-dependent protease
VTSAFGRRVASATTNRFDDEALRRVVETSERLARLVPEDPEYIGELGPQEYPDADPFFESTANLHAGRARARHRAVTEQAAAGISSPPVSHRTAPGANAVATSNGLFAYGATRA